MFKLLVLYDRNDLVTQSNFWPEPFTDTALTKTSLLKAAIIPHKTPASSR